MKSWHSGSAPSIFCWIPPAAWAWLIIFLQLSIFFLGPAVPSTAASQQSQVRSAPPPNEYDLKPIISSIRQLEDAFHSRYQYDWIFFRSKLLSDSLRRLTLNDSSATCVFEVIAETSCDIPSLHHGAGTDFPVQPEGALDGVIIDQALPLLRRIRRWNSGSARRSGRQKDFEWIWRVEKGVQYTRETDFDVFGFTRDSGIVYGFSKAVLDKEYVRSCSQQVNTLIEKHPDQLHAEADMSWLFSTAVNDGPTTMMAQLGWTDQHESSAGISQHRIFFEGSPSPLNSSNADSPQEDASGIELNSSLEKFLTWLSYIYKAGGFPTIDIGSLAFVRRRINQVLLDHIDMECHLYNHEPEVMSVPTLSTSMFLPQKSVSKFRNKAARHTSYPSPPEFTPDPEVEIGLNKVIARRVNVDGELEWLSAVQLQPKHPEQRMKEKLALWELMAQDLSRQDIVPGLRSGNTVIDERNFALS